MSESARTEKRCIVAYATPERQYLWEVRLAPFATVEEALQSARREAARSPELEVPWDSADVGIFGELVSRADVPRDGDRIELYRALPLDPREMRRRRLQPRRRGR